MNYQRIEVSPLTPAIGAVISGVDISTDLDAATVAEIRNAFHTHLVVFFRGQHLPPNRLVTFAHHFGDIGCYPFVSGMAEYPEVVEVIKKEDETINFGGLWHTDTSYLQTPPLGSVLYAVDVPRIGGDTLFSNMYLAYDALSPAMQRMLGTLRGVNNAEKPDAAATRANRIADKPKDTTAIVTTSSHPLVRTHPVTGRKALYCSNAHTTHIDGMTAEESRPLLEYIYRVQQRAEFTCRFHWEAGSVALWDNRAAQHNALNDYHGYRRVMHRVTLKGDVPQ
jgi:taurine dioxygenase